IPVGVARHRVRFIVAVARAVVPSDPQLRAGGAVLDRRKVESGGGARATAGHVHIARVAQLERGRRVEVVAGTVVAGRPLLRAGGAVFDRRIVQTGSRADASTGDIDVSGRIDFQGECAIHAVSGTVVRAGPLLDAGGVVLDRHEVEAVAGGVGIVE